jgi:hypothetical protein
VLDPRLVLDCLAGVIFGLAHQSKAYLGIDDLGGVLVRIENGNDNDGIGLFYHRPGGCGIFFAAERTLDLSIHP